MSGAFAGASAAARFAFAVNHAGDIVGQAQTAGNAATHAFLFQRGAMTDLGTLGGSDSRAFAINDAGLIVGSSSPAGGTDEHAFLYRDGRMIDLHPAGPATAWSLNNHGHVVGRFSAPASPTGWHAFRACGGSVTDLNALVPGSGAELLDASDINDSGQIVGHAIPSGSATPHAYLLTPL